MPKCMHKRKHIGVKRFDEMHELAEGHYDLVALKEATGTSVSRAELSRRAQRPVHALAPAAECRMGVALEPERRDGLQRHLAQPLERLPELPFPELRKPALLFRRRSLLVRGEAREGLFIRIGRFIG